MRVKMLVSQAGPTIHRVVGDIIDATDDEAKHLIKTGQAEPVREVSPNKEAAMLKPSAEHQAATKPVRKKKASKKETPKAES